MDREQIIRVLECCSNDKCRQCFYDIRKDCLANMAKNALALIHELSNENEKLRKQLEPFKEKQCFTCSFYGVGDDHMPCYACRDYDKYKWLGDDIHIGDRVGTIKGRGIVSVMSGDTVTVDLDGDHGSYLFFKKDVWEITEDNTKQ